MSQNPRPLTTHLLYLHGFRSSPQSFKARRMADWVQCHRPDLVFWCPQLPPSPAEAMALVRQGTAGWPAASSVVMGSSLGGFYASVVAEATGWPALVINPAVDPARDLARHIGQQTSWHDPQDTFFFREAFIDELRDMAPASLSRPERYAAVVATGDEVLDWQEMAAWHARSQLRVVQGGDHALSDLDPHWDFITHFLHLQPTSPTPQGSTPCA
ncbi:YqiA/YcfP family alpha/beta fold hydrolase [Ideonella livida]|uniref:Esterase n=1 Tax=Ideonella livida TaxID=2707176 RepID=A0A7C9PK88_9BURK|nr:YqiA/YcfP family alpha/beta fold hydrolase [Ideonella livida]NDY93271.1 esterase [Ideonella livida]